MKNSPKQPPVSGRIGYFPEAAPDPSPKKKKTPLKGRLRSLLTFVCAGVFVVCAVLLIRYFADIARARNASGELRRTYAGGQTLPQETASPTETPVPEATEETEETSAAAAAVTTAQPAETAAPFAAQWASGYADNPQLRISDRFQKLRQQNRDVVGWLSIEDVLDEPVLQRDNAYYLTHDASGQKNATGALFLDESCNLRIPTPHLVIHGHNMKEGAMFGSLKKYKLKDADFYKEHPFLTFNTLYEEAQYVIYAVAEVSVEPKDADYLPFWAYGVFTTRSQWDAYVGRIRELSRYRTQVDVQPGDRLLTLATCSGTDNSRRLLVAARLIRKGESSLTLKQSIYSTTVK